MAEMTHPDWQRLAGALELPSKALIDGHAVPARSGGTFSCINPATDGVLTEVSAGDAADIDAAVRAARRSFESGVWSRTEPGHRKAVLLRLANLLREKQNEL